MSTAMRKTRAQSLVELAILLPLLLVIFMLILDLGRGIYYYSVIHNAAREGARYGVVHPEDTAGILTAAQHLVIGLNPDDLSIVPSLPTATTIRVTITYSFQLVTPLAGMFNGSNAYELISSSEMVIEK